MNSEHAYWHTNKQENVEEIIVPLSWIVTTTENSYSIVFLIRQRSQHIQGKLILILPVCMYSYVILIIDERQNGKLSQKSNNVNEESNNNNNSNSHSSNLFMIKMTSMLTNDESIGNFLNDSICSNWSVSTIQC
jgi:hypothetical protein